MGFGPLGSIGTHLIGLSWWELAFDHEDVQFFEDFDKSFPQGIESHHFFGMTDKEKLFSLFKDGILGVLFKKDFVLRVYEPPKESSDWKVFPDGQVVFVKDKAELIKELELC